MAAYAAESLVEIGASIIPFAGGPITLAWEKALARREALAQRERDFFLYRLSLSLQAQMDELGGQMDSLTARFDDPNIQNLIAKGVDATAGKTDPEIDLLAEAVGRVITARGGDLDEDAPALLDIVGHLREGDIGVLRSLVTAVRPGDTRTTEEISKRLDFGSLRTQAALLRLDTADLVSRASSGVGESTWTPTRLGVQVAEAMGETTAQTLPDGWTQADADLLIALIDLDEVNPSAIPTLDEVAERLDRSIAELDASGQVLEGAGYVTRHLTLGSPYAHALILQDSAYIWKEEQDRDAFIGKADELEEALQAVPDGQMTGSAELASRLNIHPRLVQAILRRLVNAGYLKQLDKERRGPLHVMPTEKLRRSASSDTET